MTARQHHFLSQCYLKGFTSGDSKNSKLSVLDLSNKKQFETIPRNVGGLRDFNRIDATGIDQNILEKSLSNFESEAATALRKIKEGASFQGELKELVLYLVALLATRSPERREHRRKFHAQVAEKMMDISLASKERWESQMQQMKEHGREINGDVSYEEVKRFHESKEYSITVAREFHIRIEFEAIKTIYPLLYARKWLLVETTDDSGPFITSDNPVNLVWKEPDNIPPFYRNSPGYGMRDTQVFIPLSKSLGLIGEFDGHEGLVKGTLELVAALNSKTILFAHKQLYSPNFGFYFVGNNGALLSGKQLLSYIESVAHTA